MLQSQISKYYKDPGLHDEIKKFVVSKNICKDNYRDTNRYHNCLQEVMFKYYQADKQQRTGGLDELFARLILIKKYYNVIKGQLCKRENKTIKEIEEWCYEDKVRKGRATVLMDLALAIIEQKVNSS